MLSDKFIYEYINNNKSGKMSSEKYVLSNFEDDYNEIINFCISNYLFDLPFKEKVYYTFNGIKKIIICKNPTCNNVVKFKNSTIGYNNYCCNVCVGDDPIIIRRKEEKSILKYGTKTPAESEVIKKKILNTNNKKYGGNSPMCNNLIKNKSKETLKTNYNVENPSHSEEILNKRIKSFKENINKWKESYRTASIKKYGVEHPWMNSDIHDLSVVNSKKKKEQNLYEVIKIKLLDYPNLKLISINYDNRNIKLKCDDCNGIFNIHREYLHLRHKNLNTICTNCNPLIKSVSGYEISLYNYISSLYNGTIIRGDRNILNGSEIDIYLPDLNIAFEFNGLYWHSELFKEKNYHFNKTKECLVKGVQLFHIWEDDWCLKKDIIKSIIKNKLHKTDYRIYARECKIEYVSIKDSLRFLNENHIQGGSKSSIKIGLYYRNELVSLMCFSKPRGVNINDVYELSRFCNKIDHNVIGSSSKLLKYFITKNKPLKIISYSDKSIFDGGLYRNLGFCKEVESKVNYKWVIGKKRCHKSKFRKSNLIKMGYDMNKSESRIMYEDIGAFKIWDCGLVKWTLVIGIN